jgi:hypothetical protein
LQKKIAQNLKHRTGSLVSCCQLLAKLLDSPQQPASFPLPVQSSTTACHGSSPSVSLGRCLRLCAFVCVFSWARFFLVCEKAVFTVPYVVPMRVLCSYGNSTFHWTFWISIYFCFSLTFLAFRSIFAFHWIF